MRDTRDPEKLGKAIINLKQTHPNASAAKRADMMEEWYQDVAKAYVNGQMKFLSAYYGNGVGSK